MHNEKLISRGSTQGLYRDSMGPRPALTAGPTSPVSLIFNEEENRPGLVYYGGSQEGQKGRSTLSTINTTKITTVRRVIGWLEERLFERASSTFNDNKTNKTKRTTTTTISWWKRGAIVQIGGLPERAWRSLEASTTKQMYFRL